MLCCFPSANYAPNDRTEPLQLKDNLSSYVTLNKICDKAVGFSGQRRECNTHRSNLLLVKTHGNALSEYNTLISSDRAIDLVNVIVPKGVNRGDMLKVSSGNGSEMHVIVPARHEPGHSFFVQFPAKSENCDLVMGEAATPNDDAKYLMPVVTGGPPFDSEAPIKMNGQDNNSDQRSPAYISDDESGTSEVNTASTGQTTKEERFAPPRGLVVIPEEMKVPYIATLGVVQSTVPVTVPPGVEPGTTIFVQVPGESRVLPARVPPNGVCEFYLLYTPEIVLNYSAVRRAAQQRTSFTKGISGSIGDAADQKANAGTKQVWHNYPMAYAAPMVMWPMFV